ncbi:MAG: DUF4430 domain-containing protein [Bacteriovoracaceae bacterium]|nr:DUF4430 domain-containing protein [Bacteriovoracaceae bacterium]
MKTIKLILLVLTIASNSYAAKISFIGPCDSKPIFKTQIKIEDEISVGAFTVKALEQNDIPFKGSEGGMNSIFNTPIGLDAMEVLSDTEMLSHGWCYSVNGVEPRVFTSNYIIEDKDEVLWWFGHARYIEGEWVSQCIPTHTIDSELFCNDK